MLKKIIKSLFTFRKIMTFLLIAVGVGLTFLAYRISNQVIVTNSLTWIERLYYSVQIVSGIYIVAGAVIGVWQYYISTRSEKIKNDMERVNRAIELAGYFKDNILYKAMPVQYVYEQIGVCNILNKINKEDIKIFDSNELHENIAIEDIEILKGKYKSKEFVESVIKADCIFNLGLNYHKGIIVDIAKNIDVGEVVKINFASISNAYLNSQVNALLNNLEYFAMFFKNEVADDIVVYQSLHQTYINTVELLYYNISVHNTNPSEKYYTNIIYLYNKWKNMNNEQKRKISEQQEKTRYCQIDREPLETMK